LRKFFNGFGGFLILLGTVGIINHISLSIIAAKDEQELYGGSISLMIIQMIGTSISPYLTCIIAGGLFIAIAFFLSEYQKRSELTSELIKVLSQQRFAPQELEQSERPSQQENFKDITVANTSQKNISQPKLSTNQDNERYYWKG
jgi:hypothetical protein